MHNKSTSTCTLRLTSKQDNDFKNTEKNFISDLFFDMKLGHNLHEVLFAN